MLRKINYSKKLKELESVRLLGKIMETHREKKIIIIFITLIKMIEMSTKIYAGNSIPSITVIKARTNRSVMWLK